MSILIRAGFPEDQREAAATLYWQAFKGKLGKLMAPETKALEFLQTALRPDHAISAVDKDNHLLGLAGFKTDQGAMVEGNLSDMQRVYGGFGGLWRGALLGFLDREVEQGVLLMDGICVARDARGQGLGTRLLRAIKDEAQTRGATSIRLDVIDNNPRAKALYLREGFQPKSRETLGPLRLLFGFSSAQRMDYAVAQKNPPRRDAAN